MRNFKMWYKLLTRLGLDNLALVTPRAITVRKLEAYQKPILHHLMKIFLYPHLQNEIKGWEGEVANRWLFPAMNIRIDGKKPKLFLYEENLIPELEKNSTIRAFKTLIFNLTTKKDNPFPEPNAYSVQDFLKKYSVFRRCLLLKIKEDSLLDRTDVEDLIQKHFIEV